MRPIPAARRSDRFVVCATALLRYLPEAQREQLGHYSSWSCEPPTAAMCRRAAVGAKVGSKGRLVLQAKAASDPVAVRRIWLLSASRVEPMDARVQLNQPYMLRSSFVGSRPRSIRNLSSCCTVLIDAVHSFADTSASV